MKNLLRTSLLLMALLISVTAIAQTSSSAADQAAKSTKTTKAAKTKRKAVAKNTKAVPATPSAEKPASAMTPAEVAKAAQNAAAAPAVAPAAIRMDDATAPAGVSITPNQPVAEEAAPAIPVTTIKFEETTFDFGQIKQGETVTHKFKFTNTGSNPLVLENVKPSCGCTAINWPKEPIAPQATGEIEAQFNSTGKVGDQLKNITITLNTVEHLERLTFTGVVIAPPTDGTTPAHAPGDGHQH